MKIVGRGWRRLLHLIVIPLVQVHEFYSFNSLEGHGITFNFFCSAILEYVPWTILLITIDIARICQFAPLLVKRIESKALNKRLD